MSTAGDRAEAGRSAAADGAPTTGLLLMTAAMLMIPVIDILAKLLGAGGFGPVAGSPIPALQVAWARFSVQLLLVAPIALVVVGAACLRPAQPGLAALRGVLIAAATTFFFAGLQFLDVAEAIAIFFVEPLILTVLSALVLGERIGWRRVAAVLLGLCGALIIIRPNFIEVGWPALLPLCAAACFACYLLLTKLMTAREHALTLHLWAGLSASVILSALFAVGATVDAPLITWVAPTDAQWTMMVALGAIAAFGHFLVVMAFRRAPASQLAPLQYVEIIGATALGFLVFGEWPGAATWIGVAIIVSAGFFVFWRERIRAEEAAGARPEP